MIISQSILKNCAFRWRIANLSKWFCSQEKGKSVLLKLKNSYKVNQKDPILLKKKRILSWPTKTVYWQVIGTGAIDGFQTLALVTDHGKYVFNCAEGSQRLLCEQGHRKDSFAFVNGVFLTRMQWQFAAGFPCTAMNVKKFTKKTLIAQGPGSSIPWFRQLKQSHNFKLWIKSPEDVHKDETVTIEPVLIKSKDPPVIPKPVNKPNLISKNTEIKLDCLCYIVSIRKILDMKEFETKCKALGIPPGLLRAELKAGGEVVLENGQKVTIHDVCQVDGGCERVMIVDCPSLQYLSHFVAKEQLRQVNDLIYVFHFTPEEVMNSDLYSTWMRSFGDQVQHISLNETNGHFGSVKVLSSVQRMKIIAPDLFPNLSSYYAQHKSNETLPNVLYPESGVQFHHRPLQGMSESKKFDEVSTSQRLSDSEEISCLIKETRKSLVLDKSLPEYPKVTFLGTGSSYPHIYRNYSGVLIETKKNCFIVLDCGDGFTSQLKRHFGPQKSSEILSHLKAVFITHHHGDHYVGLTTLCLEKQKLNSLMSDRLIVFAPITIPVFLNANHWYIEPFLHTAEFFNNTLLLRDNNEDLESLAKKIGLKEMKCCYAVHVPESFSFSLTTDETDFKIAYSGDTRPNKKFIKLGKQNKSPDLLIHEATYLKNNFAISSKHSTLADALEVGEAMGAQLTLLTHFSGFYKRTICLEDEVSDKIGVAYDHMTISPQSMHQVRKMSKLIQKVFHYDVTVINGNYFKQYQ